MAVGGRRGGARCSTGSSGFTSVRSPYLRGETLREVCCVLDFRILHAHNSPVKKHKFHREGMYNSTETPTIRL